MIQLHLGDCLDVMKGIREETVGLVLTDPPYNINHKGLAWDKIQDYSHFMIERFKEAYRVLKSNGSMYFFHNDFKQMASLQVEIETHTRFRFQRLLTLTKDSYILKMFPNSKSWIPCCEYVLVYTKHENRETEQIDYFKGLHKQIGLSKAQIKKDIPEADHAFRVSINNFALPTQETYDKLISLYHLKDCKPLFWTRQRQHMRENRRSENNKNEILCPNSSQRTLPGVCTTSQSTQRLRICTLCCFVQRRLCICMANACRLHRVT
jgi:DNA modification methylase